LITREWANGLALDAAAELSAENLLCDFNISHGSIFGTLLTWGRGVIWLERWTGDRGEKRRLVALTLNRAVIWQR